ncbi:sigma-54 dependent transcriptional regulator [Luteimonas sp. 3794]|uniref:sigma-54 dependent transcriptional regulator n=1 Tax=Luteimonas sp. 3794 TaxID=2817730 RepID=UPI0028653A8A|nr:sigma-54 dependent transcriptional regulator [Luteimonas sp. 3794]MDR6990862.1 sigma-54 specific flagellar transcriptional regulator A [Luteimonas sp. 3794]
MSEPRILVIDSNGDRAERLCTLLEFMDLRPRWVSEPGEVSAARNRPSDWMAVLVGNIEDASAAQTFFAWLGQDAVPPPVLLLDDEPARFAAAHGLHEAGVWALESPLRHMQLENLLRMASLKRLDAEQVKTDDAGGPTGTSASVQALRRMIDQVAPFDTTVLVLGESGSGKEVAARAIHQRSNRRNGPFVAINCGAIPAELLESELFGHEKGAFTGALSARKGRFEMAEGGTLLLDEIGDMSLPMQVKLLRVLQERCFERVGGNQSIKCDVRVIAATHRNLEARIGDGQFREDLFYRLNVFPIEMPSLRERRDDLPELVRTVAAQLARNGRGEIRFAADTLDVLAGYAWPGNVRELCNLVERLAVLNPGGLVRVHDLPQRYRDHLAMDLLPEIEAAPVPPVPPAAVASQVSAAAETAAGSDDGAHLPEDGMDLRDHMARIELGLIREALERSDGVVAHAAQLLGLRRTTLAEKLRKYGIERDIAA